MVVDEVGAVLGLVPQPAQGQAPLAAVACIAVAGARQDHPFAVDAKALAERGGNRLQRRDGRRADVVAAVAAVGGHIGGCLLYTSRCV